MATDAPTGDGHRNGAVKKRTHIKTKVMGEEHHQAEPENWPVCGQKADAAEFKGVRKEL